MLSPSCAPSRQSYLPSSHLSTWHGVIGSNNQCRDVLVSHEGCSLTQQIYMCSSAVYHVRKVHGMSVNFQQENRKKPRGKLKQMFPIDIPGVNAWMRAEYIVVSHITQVWCLHGMNSKSIILNTALSALKSTCTLAQPGWLSKYRVITSA